MTWLRTGSLLVSLNSRFILHNLVTNHVDCTDIVLIFTLFPPHQVHGDYPQEDSLTHPSRMFTIVKDTTNKEIRGHTPKQSTNHSSHDHKMPHRYMCIVRILSLHCFPFKFRRPQMVNSLKRSVDLEEGSCDTFKQSIPGGWFWQMFWAVV